MAVIPFYGTEHPEIFRIERRTMDRAGLVIDALDRCLPASGRVLDVGAGNGHMAGHLTTTGRVVHPLEPASEMIDTNAGLPWIQGEAEHLPFRDLTFAAAYATWAYFFTRNWDPIPGLRELHRVVRTGGPILIVDNLGDDEFSALTSEEISADTSFWVNQGFACHAIDTWFEFDDLGQARKLLGYYFGERGIAGARERVAFRVGMFHSKSRGQSEGRPRSGQVQGGICF